jgi:hypothetical protein
MATTDQKNTIANSIKLYLFPALVTILSTMIWRDVTELRTDVKMLLAQSNIDKTRIDNLQKDVQLLQQKLFQSTPGKSSKVVDFYHDDFYKHEEVYDVKKHLAKNT